MFAYVISRALNGLDMCPPIRCDLCFRSIKEKFNDLKEYVKLKRTYKQKEYHAVSTDELD
jgi:DNA-directed RNA polymerase subunit N (RpoN/RPB10)